VESFTFGTGDQVDQRILLLAKHRRELLDVDLIVVSETITLDYRYSGKTMHFPQVGFLALEVYHQTICGAKITPHVEYVTLEQAATHVRNVLNNIDDLYFRPLRDSISVDSIAARLKDDTQNLAGDYRRLQIGAWQTKKEEDEVSLDIEQHHRRGGWLSRWGSGDRDLYIVNVSVRNEKIRADRRRKIHLSTFLRNLPAPK
jgi:hypothetical protein